MTHDTQTPGSTLRADSSEQLQTLNTLFGIALGSDRELTREIQQAISFSDNPQSRPTSDGYDSLTNCARRLLDLHVRDRRHCEFAHCDLRQSHFDPLWTRQRVLDTLQQLGQSRPEALILFSGLRQAVCPSGKRWTSARQQDYDQAQNLIEALCAAEARPAQRLRLIFL